MTDGLNRYGQVDGNPLSYDLRGNTLADGLTANSYQYNLLNRQTRLENAGHEADYIYDAMGRRIAKVITTTAGVTTTHFNYDKRFRVIEERPDETTWTARYTYGTGIDELLLLERGGSAYYAHRDALGSITELTDENGSMVERYEYDVYGEPAFFDGSDNAITESAVGNPYLFTGRRYDPESGNYYYRARIYSPALGRFLSMDPLGYDAGDANLYRYVFNNPVNFIDPTGEVAWFVPIIAAGAIYGVGYLLYDNMVPQNVGPSNAAWWLGQFLGYESLRKDLPVLRNLGDPCICTLHKVLAAGDAIGNTMMGISGVQGLGRVVTTAPRMVRAMGTNNPQTFLRTIATNSGAEFVEEGYRVRNQVHNFYRPPNTNQIWVDPKVASGTPWSFSRSRYVGGFYHELAHVHQGTNIFHYVSQASTTGWGNAFIVPGYLWNPMEVGAATSGIMSPSNILFLGLSRYTALAGNDMLHGSPTIKTNEPYVNFFDWLIKKIDPNC